MSRVFAVAAAILLVVGAVVVRAAIDDGGDDGSDGGTSDAVISVVCGEELRAACDALASGSYDVRVEATATTAARLSTAPADDVGLDVWVAPSPWPEIVDGNRTRGGLPPLFDQPAVLARSHLAAIVPESISTCDWGCLGDRATVDLRLGGRPLTSGLGLLHLGAFAAGHAGRADFATNDVDPAFQGWLGGVADAVVEAADPVTRLLQSRAFFDVALTHRAEAESTLATASEDRRARLSVTYPAPMVSVIAVAAPIGGRAVPAELASGLVAAGWADPTDDPSGLPTPGVLTALRELVR